MVPEAIENRPVLETLSTVVFIRAIRAIRGQMHFHSFVFQSNFDQWLLKFLLESFHGRILSGLLFRGTHLAP